MINLLTIFKSQKYLTVVVIFRPFCNLQSVSCVNLVGIINHLASFTFSPHLLFRLCSLNTGQDMGPCLRTHTLKKSIMKFFDRLLNANINIIIYFFSCFRRTDLSSFENIIAVWHKRIFKCVSFGKFLFVNISFIFSSYQAISYFMNLLIISY